MISATVIADSISPDGHRLTTMVWRYPRFIHSEVMTHRMLSRNAASSRAIPVKKMLKQVWSDPAMPVYWGANQAGMQAKAELTGWRLVAAQRLWVLAGWLMVGAAWLFSQLGLHKQIANRILEPWMWMVTIVSATDWGNLFHLRRHPDAQPEFKALADKAYEAMTASKPILLKEGQWHLPYVKHEDWEFMFYKMSHKGTAKSCSYARGDESRIFTFPGPAKEDMVPQKISAARCARVSYLNHDGTKPDIHKDLGLFEKLKQAPHASPFEHVATPCPGRHGNFNGWRQLRQDIPNENITSYPGI